VSDLHCRRHHPVTEADRHCVVCGACLHPSGESPCDRWDDMGEHYHRATELCEALENRIFWPRVGGRSMP
jgi:hypothetical protein